MNKAGEKYNHISTNNVWNLLNIKVLAQRGNLCYFETSYERNILSVIR